MRLNDTLIKLALNDGRIKLTPEPILSEITGVSIDVRLGNTFKTFKPHTTPYLDLGTITSDDLDLVMSEPIVVPDDGRFILHPGVLALGVTLETVSIASDLVGWLDGRSSLARLGLQVHVTAHRIDPGWNGNIVLEFFNAGPIPLALAPGMRIGALNFEQLAGPVSVPYVAKRGAKYANQSTVESSRLNQEGDSNGTLV